MKKNEITPNNLPQDFENLSKEKQKILVEWCSKISKTKNINRGKSSYGLKHIFEYSEIGFYISNGAFKGAMLKAGFNHKNREENGLNWYFNYSEKSLNDFKEKTKKFKENSKYVFLDNVSETNRDEILEYAELKGYQLYNFIDNSNNNFNTNTYNTMIFKKNDIEN